MPEPVLRNAPLTSVVCELRFQGATGALRAVDLVPGFEAHGLSQYEREEGLQLQFAPGQLDRQEVERHRFTRPDGGAAFTVAQDLFSYEETSYNGIQPFLERWEPLAVLVADALQIEARTRLGLRYVNEVPLMGGTDRESVARAVAEELLPPWGSDPSMADLSVSLHELRFRQEEGEVTFRHGLQRAPGSDPVYLLDFDHYEQRLTAVDIAAEAERLRGFNVRVEKIFKWSITDESYEKFEPEERDND